MLTEQQAHALLEQTIRHVTADDAILVLSGSDEASTRFANNAITQNVAKNDTRLTVRAAFGNRVGSSRINQLSEDATAEAVRRAEEIARSAAPDTEYMPPVAPTSYPVVDSYDQAVADATPETRAGAIRSVIADAEHRSLKAAGSFATEFGFTAIMNTAGLFAYHRSTSARLTCTAIAPDSSGWAERESHRLSDINPESVAARACGKAITAAQPKTVEPARYTVIMEPAAVAELLAFLAWSMDAKAADEGRSAFSGKLGTTIGVPGLTLSTKPDHPDCPGSPVAEDGMASPTVRWIDQGVLTNLSYSRFWAAHTGHEFTGRPTNLIVEGSSRTLDQIVADTENGILITRFWYIRYVDPMQLLLTGMTRDGLYLIENGQVVTGLKNMRFNDSPLRMLSRVVDIGKPEPAGGYASTLAPPLKVEGFAFSSGTAF